MQHLAPSLSLEGVLLWVVTFSRRLLDATTASARAGAEARPGTPAAVHRVGLFYLNALALLAPLVATARGAVRPRHVLRTTATIKADAPKALADGHVRTDLGGGPEDELALVVHVEKLSRLPELRQLAVVAPDERLLQKISGWPVKKTLSMAPANQQAQARETANDERNKKGEHLLVAHWQIN